MKVFKLFQILQCRKSSRLSVNTTFVFLVNIDENIKRKEMKNNYSPRDNKYTFRQLLHTYIAAQA